MTSHQGSEQQRKQTKRSTKPSPLQLTGFVSSIQCCT